MEARETCKSEKPQLDDKVLGTRKLPFEYNRKPIGNHVH